MPILRFQPGSIAPVSSTYAIVGHYGESTDVAQWFDKGQRLPVVTAAAAYGPLWYVLVDIAHENARAA